MYYFFYIFFLFFVRQLNVVCVHSGVFSVNVKSGRHCAHKMHFYSFLWNNFIKRQALLYSLSMVKFNEWIDHGPQRLPYTSNLLDKKTAKWKTSTHFPSFLDCCLRHTPIRRERRERVHVSVIIMMSIWVHSIPFYFYFDSYQFCLFIQLVQLRWPIKTNTK